MSIKRLKAALVGLIAVALAAGSVALTGAFLTGSVRGSRTIAYAEFNVCGQGLRVGGDVKLRGVLVGRIQEISRPDETCRVKLGLFPEDVDVIPSNVGAQVRAKTIFGEKWVELLYPDSASGDQLAAGTTIPTSRTIDPLEVETILNTGLPLLQAIDPENLSGALAALVEGFTGHEDAVIRSIDSGIAALKPLNRDEDLVKEGIRQLAESGKVFEDVDDDLLRALANLDRLNQFTISNQALIDESLQKGPALLTELSILFETRFTDFVKLVDNGATVIGVLAARADDLDRLLNILPKFNSSWIKNLNHVCRFRQATDEPGLAVGDEVPGRCWRVHNLVSETQGAYDPGDEPSPRQVRNRDYDGLGLIDLNDLAKLLYVPVLGDLR